MSRNVVAIASSILFVVLAALIVVVPVPVVTWRPGETVDVLGSTAEGPLLQVNGLQSFETAGELHLATVSRSSVDAAVSLPEALIAHIAPDSDAMLREIIYPAGKSNEQVREEAVASMDTSRTNAVVAALRAAGQPVIDMPMVASVLLNGPANGKLQAGDLIESIDGRVVSSRDDVAAVIRNRSVGDPVVFRIIRSGVAQTVSVVTTANGESQPIAGIDIGIGYSYTPQVEYRIDPNVVGPSAGLVFSLAIYDKITEGQLIGDRVVAVTGEVDASGRVQAIGGVREKLRGAERAGATVFVLPSETCDDIGDFSTDMQLVPVATLKDAISALQLIKEGQSTMEVPTCE